MKKILIIDDDWDILELLGLVAKDFEAEVVLKSYALSISEIEQIDPDLIFLDHWLGEQSGGELCLALKQNEATKRIPVIMISASLGIGKISVDSMADGSIEKPFDIEEIQHIIKAYIG